jgi:hypothetical protein
LNSIQVIFEKIIGNNSLETARKIIKIIENNGILPENA